MALPTEIELEVVSPDRKLFAGAVKEVQAPAETGYLGVLPGHAPLLSALGSGVLAFTEANGKQRYIAVHEGVMEVLPDRVRVLAADAEWSDRVDVEKARVELERAMDTLARHDIENNIEQAQRAVAAAKARLDAYERARR